MLYFLLKIENLQFLSFHHAWHQEDGRDRAILYLKNDSSGDFQHSKQFKFEKKYLYKHSKIHKGKQTSFLAKMNFRCFSYFRPPCWCPSEGHQHGISILISINLCGTFCQITRVRNTAQTWHLGRFLIYLSSITCQFLDFIHGMFRFSFFFFQWRDSEQWVKTGNPYSLLLTSVSAQFSVHTTQESVRKPIR